MSKTNVSLRRIETAPTSVSVTADTGKRLVDVRVRKAMKPDEARRLAVELYYSADEAEGGPDVNMDAFGYDTNDSRKLGELRSLIDEHLGWGSDDEEVDGDYEARVVQVGELMKLRRSLRVVKS